MEAGGDELRRLRIITTLWLMGLTFIPLRIAWTAGNGDQDLLVLLIGVWTSVLVLLGLIRSGLTPFAAGNGFVLLGIVATTTVRSPTPSRT